MQVQQVEDKVSEPKLRFVGQPIIDVGVATIVAFNERNSPAEVTVEDMDRIVSYILSHYLQEPIKSFLSSIYPNSAYVNPTMGDEKRRLTLERYLRGYATVAADPTIVCAFCGQPACDVVYRQHIPLTAGEGMINFGPGGRPGLRVCGGCLLASQAFPLGCTIKCAGRALLVHSDNTALTLAFAKEFLQENRRILGLMDAGETKIGYPRTIVVSQLVKIQQGHRPNGREWGSLTAYHLTNYGTNPDVTIMHLPSQTVDFLVTVQGDKYIQVWQAIVARSWARPKEAKKGRGKAGVNGQQVIYAGAGQDTPIGPLGTRRNSLYEDLFDLFDAPQNFGRFVRHYLLDGIDTAATDIATANDPTERFKLVSWDLTSLFLRKVLQMDRYRIEAIREVGDRLASAIGGNNDTKLLTSLFTAKRYAHLRTALVKANNAQLKAGAAPLITFDDFVTIFEDGEDLPRLDWSLARDLIYIRVLDKLYESVWFNNNSSAAREAMDKIEQTEQEEEQEAAAS